MKVLKKHASSLLVMSMFMSTTIPQNVQARTFENYQADFKATNEKIATAFDKFRYEMTVEWDQKDPYFKQNAQRELEDSLEALRKSGVSDKEIQTYMQNNILDGHAKKDYERLVSALDKQNLSEEDAAAAAMKYMEKNYKHGAGFAGGGSRSYSKVAILVGIIIVGVVTYIIIKRCRSERDPQNEEETTTGSTEGSTDGGSTGGYHGEKGEKGEWGGYHGEKGEKGYSSERGEKGERGDWGGSTGGCQYPTKGLNSYEPCL